MSELTIEILLEEARIERVLKRYASALDARDWAGLDDVFTESATAHFQGIGHFKGRAEIVKLISSVLSVTAATQHLLANMQIEVNGTEARSTCYLQALHTGKNEFAGKTMTVWGEYRDQLQLTPAGWRIVHRELVGIHAEGDIGMAIISNS
jgi:3-phenylpropionate/cinnamic acid dioxygenase small subunit